jgi:uncharacterized protein YcbK (DUF882 family)
VVLPVLAVALTLAQALPSPAPPPAVVKSAPAHPPTGKRPTIPARKTVIRQVKKKPPRPRVIELFQVNTKETLKLRFTDERGRPVRDLQKRANRFFRCHHTNTVGRMNPRLLRLLFQTGQHWPGQRLEVVSGFRHPSVAKNPRSPHMKGLACDFRVVGVKNTDLRDYLRRAYQHIGVGYYPNSSFVHMDVRQGPSAFWIDYSGPGENALYSDNAAEDLKSGRADTFRPMKIDPSWAEHEDMPSDTPDGGAGGAGGAATAAAPGQGQGAGAVPQVQ